MNRSFLYALALLLGVCLAPQRAAAQDVNPSDMLRGAQQIVQLVGEGRTGELWDGAAAATKKRVPRAEFITTLAGTRGNLGVTQQRVWVAITRVTLDVADPAMAGQYLSVEFETRFAGSNPSRRELVSFHRERDGVWRFSGYVLR